MALICRFRHSICSFLFLLVLSSASSSSSSSLSLSLSLSSSIYIHDSLERDVVKDDEDVSNNRVLSDLRGGDLSDPASSSSLNNNDNSEEKEGAVVDDISNNNNSGNDDSSNNGGGDTIRERMPAFGQTVQARIQDLKKSQIIQSLHDKMRHIERPSLFSFYNNNNNNNDHDHDHSQSNNNNNNNNKKEGSSFVTKMVEAKRLAKGVLSKVQDESTNVWSYLASSSGPVTSAILHPLCQPDNHKPLTTMAVFLLSFVGSSLGFHSFLYFVSIGFGLAVALITTTALISFNMLSKYPVPALSNVHTSLALLWALRLMIFLLHREYVNWPDWHLKIYEVNQRAKLGAKYYVWSTVGPFYAMLTLPCIYRLQQTASAAPSTTSSTWGVVGISGIFLQFTGLLIETIADIQKAKFKCRNIQNNNYHTTTNNNDPQSSSSLGANKNDEYDTKISGSNGMYDSGGGGDDDNRYNWCNEGLWGFSTHPNYLGELMFWTGTYMGGMASYERPSQWIFTTIGLVFIASVLKDACDTLGAKHLRNYGQNMDFMEFRRTHNILGPLFPGRSSTIL